MPIKFSEDIVALSDLKINPGKFVKHTKNSQRPILLTSHGHGVAVMQGLQEYEKLQEERDFMKAVAQGLLDLKEGKVHSLDEVKSKLGL